MRMGTCDEEVNFTWLSWVSKEDWDTLDLNTTVPHVKSVTRSTSMRVDGCTCEYTATDTDHNRNPLHSANHERISRYREHLLNKLTLKLGAQVILRHIDADGGWVNSTLASVVAMHENCIVTTCTLIYTLNVFCVVFTHYAICLSPQVKWDGYILGVWTRINYTAPKSHNSSTDVYYWHTCNYNHVCFKVFLEEKLGHSYSSYKICMTFHKILMKFIQKYFEFLSKLNVLVRFI